MRASEIMTVIPNCCLPSSPARTAATILKKFGLGALPVVDDYINRKLVGVVTDRDLCTKALAEPRVPEEALVEDCMARDPVFCTPETSVRTVLALMVTHRIRRVPVVDPDGRVVGMVTLTDLFCHEAVPAKDLCNALRHIVAPVKQAERAHAAAAGAT